MGSYTVNNVPIKGVGNKISGERFYKITLEISLNSSIVMDPFSGYNFNFDSSQLLIKQHFLDAMYFYLSLLKVRWFRPGKPSFPPGILFLANKLTNLWKKVLSKRIFLYYWKCNFPMTHDVRLSVCHNFPYRAGYISTSTCALVNCISQAQIKVLSVC